MLIFYTPSKHQNNVFMGIKWKTDPKWVKQLLATSARAAQFNVVSLKGWWFIHEAKLL